MSLVIFQDIDGEDLGVDPSRIILVEADGRDGLSCITFQLGYRGEIATRIVKHSVMEIVEALNKVDPFG